MRFKVYECLNCHTQQASKIDNPRCCKCNRPVAYLRRVASEGRPDID